MDQNKFIHDFNDKYRPKFNKDLFTRGDDETIDQLKKIIISCQRDKFFTIKVKNFRVVEDYEDILNILRENEERIYKKNKKKENQYDYIDLNDSDIILLIVTYYIRLGDEEDTFDVYIAIPRIVKKFYFRIKGNIYSAMYQIVDASTYNNSTSSSKKSSVTLKTMFMPIRVYRAYENIKDINKNSYDVALYTSRIFSKSLPALKYILARFGLYGAMEFLNIGGIIYVDDKPFENENYISFEKNGIYISVAKYVFERDEVVQSMVRTIIRSIINSKEINTTINDLRSQEYWLKILGLEFNNFTVEKGLSVLDSFESIYDESTKDSIHLPERKKENIYTILKWMIGNFSALKLKSNPDISTKKIRYSEYIASLYAMKLSTGIYRVSDLGKRAKLMSIKKAININPTYLLSAISRCQLVNYRNMVNDLDALTEMKFTYKGIAGIGEQSNSVPSIYRNIDVSHLGRLDPDSSSNSDPGVTGSICPLAPLYDMHFSEFEEPNYWEYQLNKTMDTYRELTGIKQVINVKQALLDIIPDKEEVEQLDEDIACAKKLIVPIIQTEKNSYMIHGIDPIGSGEIYVADEND